MLDLLLDWRAWALVILLTSLTLITSVAKYRLGQSGLKKLKEKYPQVSDERWQTVEAYFNRWGSPVVLLSFLPLLAWIIPPAAGAFGIRFGLFLVWAFLAKMLRYWIIVLILFGGFNLIFD
jgi:membrane protein YqaA with SNARE-associated domain